MIETHGTSPVKQDLHLQMLYLSFCRAGFSCFVVARIRYSLEVARNFACALLSSEKQAGSKTREADVGVVTVCKTVVLQGHT